MSEKKDPAEVIETLQQILAQPEWSADTIERVNEALIEAGYTEHSSNNVWDNPFLRRQLTDEIATDLGELLDMWDLGFDLRPTTLQGFASSIVVSLNDIHTSNPPKE